MQALPDPHWPERLDRCPFCGYDRAGLGANDACPECGGPGSEGVLVLAGVPTRMGGSGPRAGVRILVVVLAVLLFQGLVIFVLYARWVLLVGPPVIVALLVWLLWSSPRERRGVERFVITRVGLVRLPLSSKPGSTQWDAEVVPWAEDAAFELKSVGAIWANLSIGRSDPSGAVVGASFKAGVRCPEAMLDGVRNSIAAAIAARTNPGTLAPCPTSSASSSAPGG